MKKLLAIVTSALTLGAFADASKLPIQFELPEGLEAGTVNLVCDGETVMSDIAVTGSVVDVSTNDLGAGDYWLALADGTQLTEVYTIEGNEEFIYSSTVASVKLAGEGETVVYDCVASFVSETETNTLPDGWTSKQYNGINTPHFTLAANGAVVKYPWKKNALQTACDITNGAKATIDVVTHSTSTDCNAVIFLASENYSVAIGNSYNSNKAIVIGSAEVDASTKYASFQATAAATVGFVPDNQVTVAEAGALNVGGSLHYNLVINGTELSGTVTDGTTTKDIAFTLPEEYAFTTVGCALDGDTNKVGLKSFSIADNRKDLYLTVGNNVQHIDLGKGETFTDAEGAAATHESRLDTIHVNNSVQLFVYRAYSGAKFIVGDEDHAEVNLGFARTNSGDATMDSFDVTVNNNGIVEINNVTRGGSWNASMNPEVKGSKIHGSGKVTIPSGQNVTISDASVIELPIEMSGTATLVVKTGSTVASVTTTDTNKVIKSEEVDGGVKYTVVTEQVTLKIPAIDHTKAQYKYEGGEWIDAPAATDGYHNILVDKSRKFYFQYVADEGYTVSGSQSGYVYSSGLSSNTTYDDPKTGLTVTANVTQEDVEASVADVSAAIVDLINGAESVTVTIPTGVTITITGAATLEGLAESESKTTVVGDGTEKTVTRPAIESTTSGFYKVEATTAK